MGNGENVEMKPFIIKNGVILGLIGPVLVMAMYIIDYTFIVNWKFQVISLITSLAMVIYFGRQFRTEGSGYIRYGKAFKLTFFILIVSGVINLLFGFLLFNVLDPELPQLLAKEAIANGEEMLRSVGMPQSQIDAQTKIMEAEMPANFTPLGQLKNSWFIILSSTIIASIAGIFIRKSEPIMG